MTNKEAIDKLIDIKAQLQLLLDMYYNGKEVTDAFDEAIRALQEPKTEWIPVSERLPEKNVWVLVTVEQSGNRYQEIMRRNNYIEAWTDNIDNYTDEITAWMPLPEPYKESEGRND